MGHHDIDASFTEARSYMHAYIHTPIKIYTSIYRSDRYAYIERDTEIKTKAARLKLEEPRLKYIKRCSIRSGCVRKLESLKAEFSSNPST